MSIYTYVVNHGKNSPAVGLSTVVNGGQLQAVMFDDAITKLEVAEELLQAAREQGQGQFSACLLSKINDYFCC